MYLVEPPLNCALRSSTVLASPTWREFLRPSESLPGAKSRCECAFAKDCAIALSADTSLFGSLMAVASLSSASAIHTEDTRDSRSRSDYAAFSNCLHRHIFDLWLASSVEQQAQAISDYTQTDIVPSYHHDAFTFLAPASVGPLGLALLSCDLRAATAFNQLKSGRHGTSFGTKRSPCHRAALAINTIKKSSGSLRLTLTVLASALGISDSHLGRIFLATTTAHFREYVRATRIYTAARLVAESPLRLKDVANALGYTDLSNFNRDFRVIFHTNPSTYRRTQSAAPANASQVLVFGNAGS